MSWLAPLEIGISQGLLFAWAVLGFSLAYRILNFPDLTVEGSVPLAAAVYAVCIRTGLPVSLAAALAVLTGSALGATTAFLHTRFKVNKFLAGIIVVSMAYTLTLRLMKGPNLSLINQPSFVARFSDIFADGRLGSLIFLGLLSGVGITLIVGFLGSAVGVELRAVGSNPTFASSLGIRSDLRIVLGLAITNGFAALSGVLVSDRQGFADVGLGQGILILALAAMAVGEVAVPQKIFVYYRYVIASALLGSVLYQVILSYAVRAGLEPMDLRLATGLLVLFVVAVRLSSEDNHVGDTLLE
jgi:putative ABC transport system permease protein